MSNTPTLPPPPWLNGGRIPSLDGLRALAVAGVILAHAHQTPGFPGGAFVHALCHKGAVGVELFFVLSGFLITLLMLREVDDTGTVGVGAFYWRRVLRIVPAYACYLVAVWLLAALGEARLSPRDWLLALTYTVNFVREPAWEIGHVWSLSIEEHFYLLWPLMMALRPRAGRSVALACLALCFVGRWVVLLAFPAYTPMAELWTFTRIDAVATGCLLAFLARDPDWRARLDRAVAGRAALPLVLGALAASLALSSSGKYSVGVGYSLNALLLALLLWAAVRRPEGLFGRLLNARPLRAVGLCSYSLYLWQQPFLSHAGGGLARAFPQNVLLACVAAYLSYRLIERPVLALRRAPAVPDAETPEARPAAAPAPMAGPYPQQTVSCP